MTKETKYCPNPDECDGKCPTLNDKIHEIDNKLNNVLKFIDNENIQPIIKELQSVIKNLTNKRII